MKFFQERHFKKISKNVDPEITLNLKFGEFISYCQMCSREQNNKNWSIFGDFPEVGASQRTKWGIIIVLKIKYKN